MIAVIIPVLNESERIASVVDFASRGPLVSEVIVVDDGSIDGTPDLAQATGATIETSQCSMSCSRPEVCLGFFQCNASETSLLE